MKEEDDVDDEEDDDLTRRILSNQFGRIHYIYICIGIFRSHLPPSPLRVWLCAAFPLAIVGYASQTCVFRIPRARGWLI